MSPLPDPGVHGDARGNRGVDAAGRSELRDRHRHRGTRPGVVGDAGPLLAEHQQAVARQRGLLQSHRPGHVVDGDDGQPGIRGEGRAVRRWCRGGAAADSGRSPWRRGGSSAAGRRCARCRRRTRWPCAPHRRCWRRCRSSRSRCAAGAFACRCRRRSPPASSTGRRRRRCGCRRHAAVRGRSAGRRAAHRALVSTARRRRRSPIRSGRGRDSGSLSLWSTPRRGCRPPTPSRTAAPR